VQFCWSHSLAVALTAGHECSFTRSQHCARACITEYASGNCKRVRHLHSALCELQAALGLVVCAGRGTASRRLRLRSCSRLPPALLQLLQADILLDQALPAVSISLTLDIPGLDIPDPWCARIGRARRVVSCRSCRQCVGSRKPSEPPLAAPTHH